MTGGGEGAGWRGICDCKAKFGLIYEKPRYSTKDDAAFCFSLRETNTSERLGAIASAANFWRSARRSIICLAFESPSSSTQNISSLLEYVPVACTSPSSVWRCSTKLTVGAEVSSVLGHRFEIVLLSLDGVAACVVKFVDQI